MKMRLKFPFAVSQFAISLQYLKQFKYLIFNVVVIKFATLQKKRFSHAAKPNFSNVSKCHYQANINFPKSEKTGLPGFHSH